MVANKCETCKYARMLTTSKKKEGREYYCNYVCLELKMRPCPAGDECTVYVKQDENFSQSKYYRNYPVKIS